MQDVYEGKWSFQAPIIGVLLWYVDFTMCFIFSYSYCDYLILSSNIFYKNDKILLHISNCCHHIFKPCGSKRNCIAWGWALAGAQMLSCAPGQIFNGLKMQASRCHIQLYSWVITVKIQRFENRSLNTILMFTIHFVNCYSASSKLTFLLVYPNCRETSYRLTLSFS
jgi:hypothetical protein